MKSKFQVRFISAAISAALLTLASSSFAAPILLSETTIDSAETVYDSKSFSDKNDHGLAFIADKASITIQNSTFEKNTATGAGGGLYIRGASNESTIVIKNSVFSNNEARNGGGIFIDANKSKSSDAPQDIKSPSIRIEGCTFEGNLADGATDTAGSAIEQANNIGSRPAQITIVDSSFQNNRVGEKTQASSIFINSKSSQLSVIQPEGWLEIIAQDDNVLFDDGPSEKPVILLQACNFKLHAAEGKTITINGEVQTTGKTPLIISEENEGNVIFENDVWGFRISHQSGMLTLNGQCDKNNKKPDRDYYRSEMTIETTRSPILNIANNKIQHIAFQTIRVTGGGTASLNLDVDLAESTSDRIDGEWDNSSDGHLAVANWNVLAGNSEENELHIKVTDTEAVANALMLADSGKTAHDAVLNMDWNVEYLDQTVRENLGTFRFWRPLPPVPETPLDFNTPVYMGELSQISLGMIGNQVSASLLETPAREKWWAQATGMSMNVNPENFTTFDLDTATLTMGRNFESVQHNDWQWTNGLFIGMFAGKTKLDSADISDKESGAFVGVRTELTRSDWWLRGHAMAGYAETRFKGASFKDSDDRPWFSLGMGTGYAWQANDKTRLDFALLADYVKVNRVDCTTESEVRTAFEDWSQWEISPKIAFTRKLSDQWTASGFAKYSFVDSDGTGYVKNLDMALPEIRLDDYVEYGLSAVRKTENHLFELDIKRHDIGETGWSAKARIGTFF